MLPWYHVLRSSLFLIPLHWMQLCVSSMRTCMMLEVKIGTLLQSPKSNRRTNEALDSSKHSFGARKIYGLTTSQQSHKLYTKYEHGKGDCHEPRYESTKFWKFSPSAWMRSSCNCSKPTNEMSMHLTCCDECTIAVWRNPFAFQIELTSQERIAILCPMTGPHSHMIAASHGTIKPVNLRIYIKAGYQFMHLGDELVRTPVIHRHIVQALQHLSSQTVLPPYTLFVLVPRSLVAPFILQMLKPNYTCAVLTHKRVIAY